MMEEKQESQAPVWMRSNGNINEVAFCRQYLHENALVSQGGVFYDLEGRIYDERVLREAIYDTISPYVTGSVAKKVVSLVETMRMQARAEPGDVCEQLLVLHVANGTYDLSDGFFMEQKVICRHRLPVSYNPKVPKPERWLAFLDDLLEPQDILTLQEFMGYCLIPTNIGQKMLIITGRGGEGKSRIGVVMKSLLGQNMSLGSIAKVETNRFARADLEHLLLLLDDDLQLEALSQTNYLKTIITAELPMDLEKKGVQSYQGTLNVRFMAFGNENLQALHDKSYGFFRRQIILTAKERPVDRVDDPYLSDALRREREGIFLWCLEGLERLICRDFHFTISERAKQNLDKAIFDGNNLEEFMKSEGYFRFDPEGSISSRQFYNIYRDWCEDNLVKPLSSRTVWSFLGQNASRFGLRQSNKIWGGNGKLVRGFRGMRELSRF